MSCIFRPDKLKDNGQVIMFLPDFLVEAVFVLFD